MLDNDKISQTYSVYHFETVIFRLLYLLKQRKYENGSQEQMNNILILLYQMLWLNRISES